MELRSLTVNDMGQLYRVMKLSYPRFTATSENIKQWFPTTVYEWVGLFKEEIMLGFAAYELQAGLIKVRDMTIVPAYQADWDVVLEAFQLFLKYCKETYVGVEKISVETCATHHVALNTYKKLGLDVCEYLAKRANGEPGVVLERVI